MYDNDTYQPRPRRNSMATAATIFGVLALFSCSAVFIALPCGALAIICAILSRNSEPMSGKGKAAVICGICGIVASTVITAVSMQKLFTDPQLRSSMESLIQLYTGDFDFDLDELLEEYIPFFHGDSEEDDLWEDDAPADDFRQYEPGDEDLQDSGTYFLMAPGSDRREGLS